MGFITDKQTLDDLNLLKRYGSDSIFGFFNQVKTKGGELLLSEMFRNPLSSENEINARSALFQYFQHLNLEFPLDKEDLSVMETFLRAGEQSSRFTTFGQTVRRQSLYLVGLREEYELFIKGLRTTVALLAQLDQFFSGLTSKEGNHQYDVPIRQFQKFYKDEQFAKLRSMEKNGRISVTRLMQYTYLLGHVFYEELLALLKLVYQLDVYIAVSQVASKNKLTYAKALPAEFQNLFIKNCRYPVLKSAVGNDVILSRSTNLLFLTGANMAGKSTFMKSVGVSVYLAHMGFPVAADEMEFSVKDGMFSSINVPDDISQGYSHFYAEVLRVKTVAEQVAASKNLLVIFDELFKGTNVKDAYDATLAVTDAFAAYHNCTFIISTHILEVTPELSKTHDNIQFSYFPTIMKGKVPSYTYRLEKGVSADRHGMMIISNEGILEMLKA